MTERQQRGIELLLSELEVVASLEANVEPLSETDEEDD